MNQNKFLLGGLVGGLAFFLFGWLIYGMVAEKMIAANTMTGVSKEMPTMWALLVGSFSFSFLLSYLYERWAHISTFSGGAAAGTIIGFLMYAGMDFNIYGSTNMMNLTAVIIDIIAGTALFALAGGVIGWFLGYNRKA